MRNRDEALTRAIAKVGTAEALAEQLGIRPQAIAQWERVPVLRVLDVEKATGIARHELRPDIYPRPLAGSEAA